MADLFGNENRPAPRKPSPHEKLFSSTVFFAFLAGPGVLAQARAILDAARTEHGLKGSSVTDERVHISLHEVGMGDNEARIAQAKRAADAVVAAPFEIVLDTLESFRRPPSHPLTLKSRTGAEGVKLVGKILGVEMKRVGLPSPPAVKPHMTLGYYRSLVGKVSVEPIRWAADAFVMVRSQQGQYEILGRWPLEG